jgi:DNA replication and repair protein RecF
LKFRRLKLTHFRNHAGSELNLPSRIIGIGGPNGAGKTTVLDAVHYLAVTRGLTSSFDRSYVNKDAEFFRVEGEIDRGEDIQELVVKYQSGRGKTIEVDGEKIEKLRDYIGRYPVVSMIPQDIDLILSGSRERRRMLDLGFSQIDPDYLESLLVYRKLLRQRNAYLKEVQKSGKFQLNLLNTYDQRMVPYAENLHQRRRKYIDHLQAYFSEFYHKISLGGEEITLEYLSQLNEEDYLNLTAKNLEKDRIMGRSHAGIHKDDLNMTLLGDKLRDVASQGQLKSGVLALKLAIHKLIVEHSDKQPVFLIDDLFDRLDTGRANAFLGLIKGQTSGQIFITDTNIERLKNSVAVMNEKFTIFSVLNGKVEIIA